MLNDILCKNKIKDKWIRAFTLIKKSNCYLFIGVSLFKSPSLKKARYCSADILGSEVEFSLSTMSLDPESESLPFLDLGYLQLGMNT